MLKILKRIKTKEYLIILLVSLIIAIQVYLELKIPEYITKITTLITSKTANTNNILNEGYMMLIYAFLSLLLSFIAGYFITLFSSNLSSRLRVDIFKKVFNLSYKEVKDISVSSLITRTTNDVNQIQTIIAMGLQVLIKSPIMTIWATSKILQKDLTWTILTALAVLIILIIVLALVVLVLPKIKVSQNLLDKLNLLTDENLKGIKVIHAFSGYKYQLNKFNKTNKEYMNLKLFINYLMALISPVMSFMLPVLTILIYYYGAINMSKATLVNKIVIFSDMIVFSAYAIQIIFSLILLIMVFIMLPKAIISSKRINEVLNKEETITSGKKDSNKKNKGVVEFKNVSYKYSDSSEYVLKDINFKINKGETVAFIGSTASGKSTLLNLIPRFFDTTSGEVFIDEINVKDYNLSKLYDKIAYIPQKAIIFKGTILENIKFNIKKNKKPNNLQVNKALKNSESIEFVRKLPKDYEISQMGANLSGGQKQRLSIARGISQDVEIMLFDDTFSALDFKTDAKLRKNINKEYPNVTKIIVAQRIGTIIHADKIIVLEKGKIVGMGKHEELLKTCPIYLEIAKSQLNEDEIYENK